MTIVVDPEEWAVFQTMTQQLFVDVLIQLAQNVQLEKYKKHRRGPKLKAPPRTSSNLNFA